jgi:hypothetical protein
MKNIRLINQARFILKFAFMLLVNLSARAQSTKREVVSQSIEWLSLNSNIKIHKHYGLTVDLQNRFVQDLSSMQHMWRVGFELYVTPKLSVAPIGYAYIYNYQYGKQPASIVNNERRVWQHIMYKHTVGRIAVSHRLRLEERFIQSHHKDTDGNVINDGYSSNKQTRLRYRLITNIPLNHAKMEAKTFYVSIWDEIFISRGKLVTYNEPDQNRLFIGAGYQITKKVAVQSGYFYQLLIKSNGAKQENNSGIMVQLNYNFDFTRQSL